MNQSYLRDVFYCLSRIIVLGCLAVGMSHASDDPLFKSQGSWGQDYDDQWALKRVLDGADLQPSGGAPVVIAIIDTGVDYQHPDLARDRIWRNSNERDNGIDDDENGYVDDLIGWDFANDTNNPWDNSGHGTHVAGIIAATTNNGRGVAGMTNQVQVMPLKVLTVFGRGRADGVAAAIYYAVANGARVVNMSLGGAGQSPAQQRALQYAFDKGVLVVVASGNEGANTQGFGPAELDTVLTVGASGPDDKRLGFSNWGSSLDLVAPGQDVVSLRARFSDFALVADTADYVAGEWIVGADAGYYRASGTSFAAPFVSGAAAVLLARDPGLEAPDLMRILRQSARDTGTPGVDQFSGYGLVSLKAALELPPGFFLRAQIAGVEVVEVKGQPAIRVLGTAAADRFGEAWVELGEGDEPARWKKAGKALREAVQDDALVDIPGSAFGGASQWTLRLRVKHKDGREQEARYVVDLG